MSNAITIRHVTEEGEAAIRGYWHRGTYMNAKWMFITRVPNSPVIVPLFVYSEGQLPGTLTTHKRRIYEIYSFSIPLDRQLAERRAWNLPETLKDHA